MAKPKEENTAFLELKAALRNKDLGRLYFFHGEETFLLNHYLERIKKQLVDELTESFNFHKLTVETFNVRSFADAVENLPMMAENTMVWVDEIDVYGLDESDRGKLCDILTDIPDYCTVVFTYVTTPWKPDKRLKKLHTAVTENASVVEFQKQSPRDLIPWITRHFAVYKKRISPNLCAYLVDITGGTMTALNGEISKIAAYSAAEEIVKSDIDAVTEPVLDAVIYQMTDLLGHGECGRALQKLRTLLQMQEEPVKILAAIGGHFRRLGTARTLMDNGKGAGELMHLCSIGDYPARKTLSAAGKFSPRFYAKAAELVIETDRHLKTSYDDKARLLELLVMRLYQEARNG